MIQWIQAHYVELLAIVGSLYVAARGIVALTPTPKDDKALEGVAGWLKGVAKMFGLDLKQGITKAIILLMIFSFMATLLTGCNGISLNAANQAKLDNATITAKLLMDKCTAGTPDANGMKQFIRDANDVLVAIDTGGWPAAWVSAKYKQQIGQLSIQAKSMVEYMKLHDVSPPELCDALNSWAPTLQAVDNASRGKQ